VQAQLDQLALERAALRVYRVASAPLG